MNVPLHIIGHRTRVLSWFCNNLGRFFSNRLRITSTQHNSEQKSFAFHLSTCNLVKYLGHVLRCIGHKPMTVSEPGSISVKPASTTTIWMGTSFFILSN